MPFVRNTAPSRDATHEVRPLPDRAGSSLRTSSTARSISWGFTWRKIVHWIFEDLLIAALLGFIFLWHCTQTLPATASDGITFRVLSASVVRPDAWHFSGHGLSFDTWILHIHGANKVDYTFALLPYLHLLTPCLIFMLVVQAFGLLDFFADTRRVRRKLQPLNDLAIAAEAMGQMAATSDPMASDDKMATLEQAIERATVDSPTVRTGDRDLQSIEVALNGLLRQMQEAKLQQMRFVSDASHELRTPIAVIQGYVGMLDRWGKSDEAVLEESIEALKVESDHMQQLVEQLLFLARGDSGRNTLHKEPHNLAAITREVWDESIMIDGTHQFEYAASEDDCADPRFECKVDATMIKQALRIMVQNAQKYSPEGSTIKLGARVVGDTCRLSVTDEGMGMSEEDARHIFERFYRSDDARETDGGGSGLGLSIAKWIVDNHGGSIEVISREGVGTRFTIVLPREV